MSAFRRTTSGPVFDSGVVQGFRPAHTADHANPDRAGHNASEEGADAVAARGKSLHVRTRAAAHAQHVLGAALQDLAEAIGAKGHAPDVLRADSGVRRRPIDLGLHTDERMRDRQGPQR